MWFPCEMYIADKLKFGNFILKADIFKVNLKSWLNSKVITVYIDAS